MSESPLAVVLGARGLLGQSLAEVLPRAGWTLAAAAGRAECDIRDGAAVRALIARAFGGRPGVVFNAAGLTDVEKAEGEGEEAFAVNALAVEGLARATRDAGATLLHYSTDFVFDGAQERLYEEFDAPRPLSVYGRSKHAGEVLAAAATPRLFTVRVGCLYGRNGRNFPSTIARRLRAGETIRADQDRVGSPTWVRDVSRVSAALARTTDYGLYHCTAQGETTWADFALFMAGALGVPAERVQVLPNAALALKAARPRRAILDNRMLRARGLDTMPAWQDGVREYLSSQEP